VLAFGLILWLNSGNLSSKFQNVLLFSAYWIAPFFAIILVDWYHRRGTVSRERLARLMYFRDLSLSWPALVALVVGFAAMVPFMNTGLIVGPVATALLALTYLAVWLAFGLVCYAAYIALGMPWPNQAWFVGVALVLAGVYGLTPIKRASQARCRELCALHGPLPFNLMRSAVTAGVRYGLSCAGCSAGLMIAMVLIGMSNLVAAVLLAAAVLIYKLAPPLARRYDMVFALGVAAAGVAYAVLV